MYKVLVALLITTSNALACECEKMSIVYSLHGEGVEEFEIYELPWEFMGMEKYIDLTQTHEPEQCEVAITTLPSTHPALNMGPFHEPGPGDFEILFQGEWILASEFEKKVREINCSLFLS